MARYSLRTLLILLAIGPPLVAGYVHLHRAALESARVARLRQRADIEPPGGGITSIVGGVAKLNP